jgi:dihydrolipoamide dehydrogenase
MIIVGGGAVGLEMAEVYSALGTQITVVEMMEQVLPGEDTELARRLEAALKRKRIKILTSSRVAAIEVLDNGVRVTLEGEKVLEGDMVLVGIGRKPNVDRIGIEDVGIDLDKRSIKTDDRMRTNIPGVLACGDVTGKYLLAHVATAQGIVAAENACGQAALIDYTAVPRCVYTEPEFAAVGLTESQAASEGAKASAYKVRLGRIGRALTLGETFGLAKMVYDQDSKKVLGFHALAPHASELVSEISLAMKQGVTVEDIARVIHPHPTLSEIVWEAAEGASGKPLHGD